MKYNNLFLVIIAITIIVACKKEEATETNPLVLEKISNEKPKNVIFILSDDHGYDFMGFKVAGEIRARFVRTSKPLIGTMLPDRYLIR